MATQPDATTFVTWGDPGSLASVPGWLVLGGASSTAIHVYAILSLYVAQKSPTRQAVADILGTTEKGVQKALDELIGAGAVEKPGPRGYRLLMAQGAASPKPALLPAILVADMKKPPAIVRVNGRNLPFDALCGECAIDERSPRTQAVTAALHGRRGGTGITHLFWLECQREAEMKPDTGLAALAALNSDGDRYARLLAQAIRGKAALIRRKQPWREVVTPQLIRDLWLDIEHAPDPTKRGMTGADVLAL